MTFGTVARQFLLVFCSRHTFFLRFDMQVIFSSEDTGGRGPHMIVTYQ